MKITQFIQSLFYCMIFSNLSQATGQNLECPNILQQPEQVQNTFRFYGLGGEIGDCTTWLSNLMVPDWDDLPADAVVKYQDIQFVPPVPALKSYYRFNLIKIDNFSATVTVPTHYATLQYMGGYVGLPGYDANMHVTDKICEVIAIGLKRRHDVARDPREIDCYTILKGEDPNELADPNIYSGIIGFMAKSRTSSSCVSVTFTTPKPIEEQNVTDFCIRVSAFIQKIDEVENGPEKMNVLRAERDEFFALLGGVSTEINEYGHPTSGVRVDESVVPM